MGLLLNWQGIRGIMRLLIIQFLCCLTCFSCFAFAQFHISEAVTGSVNSPALGITCVGNLAAFVTSLIRGRLDLEIGAWDVIDFLASHKLDSIEDLKHGNEVEIGLTTCTNTEAADVVMLSNGKSNWSTRQFLKSNAPFADSILLWTSDDSRRPCVCEYDCKCIVFSTVERITVMVARRVPGTLKQLPDSLCLLPCLSCFEKGCHGCDQRLLYVEADSGRLTEGPKVDTPSVVCEILQGISAGEPICICIPMHDASSDVWTELLLRSLRSKDAESRGVRVMASEALEGYLAGCTGGAKESVEYNIVSFMVPRLTEAFINFVLTFSFKVDGFSSALVARSTVRDYIVDGKGSGLAANAFLTKANVMSDASNTQVCQVLTFRGNVVRSMSYMVGCVNLISSIGWAVLISIQGGADTSPPLTTPMLLVIIAAIAIVFAMDVACACILNLPKGFSEFCFCLAIFIVIPIVMFIVGLLLLLWALSRNHLERDDFGFGLFVALLAVLALENACIVSGSAVAGTLGIKGFGRWLYGAVQILVWIKWVLGSYLLNHDISLSFWDANHEIRGRSPHSWEILIYSSAFLLNAINAGVRCKWEPWPWK